jgi:hypothetical protein
VHKQRGNSGPAALHTPAVVKQKTHPSLHDSRVDYQWRVDRATGFEKTTLIYDAEGRLVAIDFKTSPRTPSVNDRPNS